MPLIRRSKKYGNAKRGKRKIASIRLYLVAVPDHYSSCGYIRWTSCIIVCSHIFVKVSQRRSTFTPTEARLLHRASYLIYNKPGGSYHRAVGGM